MSDDNVRALPGVDLNEHRPDPDQVSMWAEHVVEELVPQAQGYIEQIILADTEAEVSAAITRLKAEVSGWPTRPDPIGPVQ